MIMNPIKIYSILYDDVGSFSFTLTKGTYKIECWGASGGQRENNGGKGAYVSGILHVKDELKLYAYIGEEGKINDESDIFNGGGKPHWISSYHSAQYSSTCSGGGSTDIRLKGGNWNEIESLKSRIIVAGAGGGETIYRSPDSDYKYLIGKGGDAGTISGFEANCSQSHSLSTSINYSNALGGTQQEGGKGGSGNYGTGNPGEFGKGGDSTSNQDNPSSGGGSGYFGGGAGGVCANCLGAGAGGSSFVSGDSRCIAISSTYPNENSFNGTTHFSGIKFQNPIMHEGDEYFYSPYGQKEKGHTGNGAVKITFLTFLTCNQRKINILPSILVIYLTILMK